MSGFDVRNVPTRTFECTFLNDAGSTYTLHLTAPSLAVFNRLTTIKGDTSLDEFYQLMAEAMSFNTEGIKVDQSIFDRMTSDQLQAFEYAYIDWIQNYRKLKN